MTTGATFRVAIVGAGIVGSMLAYELSGQPGLTVHLFDAQQPGQGSTGAALGILMAVISQKTKGRGWRLRRHSLARYHTLLPELEQAIGQPIPGDRQGLVKLLMEDDWPRWQKLQQVRQQQGYPLDLWDRGTVEQKFPGLANTPLEGAIYSPWDWQIQPQPLTQALITAAQQRGVHCHWPESVQPLQYPQGHCHQLETTKTQLPVDYVVVTAGLGSALLTAQIGLEPVIGQAFLLQLPPHFCPTSDPLWQPVLTAEDVHLVPLGQGQYWLGATVEFPADSPTGLPNDQLRQQLWQRAIAYYPFLSQAQIINYWSGRRPRPVGESAPVIRPLAGVDNVLLATGHYRNGILLAPATAQEVKQHLQLALFP